MKTNKNEYILLGFFALFGIIFIIIGIFLCVDVLNYENKEETIGVIEQISFHNENDGNTTYDIYVSYTIDQKDYQSVMHNYSSDFYEGKKITIYYDKDNPEMIGIKSLDLLVLIFPGLGLIFFSIGGIGLYRKFHRKKTTKKLKEQGIKIEAIYLKTIINTSYSINECHPYKIICEWIDPVDQKKYIYKSVNLWTDPEDIIRQKNIKTFPVYIDRKNKKKYVVDIEILN